MSARSDKSLGGSLLDRGGASYYLCAHSSALGGPPSGLVHTSCKKGNKEMSKKKIVTLVAFVVASLVLPQPSGAIMGDPVPTDVPVPSAYVPVPEVLPVELSLAEGTLPESCLVDGMVGCPEGVWCHDHPKCTEDEDIEEETGGSAVVWCHYTSSYTTTGTVAASGIFISGSVSVTTTHCRYSGCNLDLTEEDANAKKH